MYNILSFSVEMIKLYILLRLVGYSIKKKIIAPCCVIAASFIALWSLQGRLDNDTVLIISTLLIIVSLSLLIRGRNKTIAALAGVYVLWFIDAFLINVLALVLTDPLALFAELASLIIIAAIFVIFRIQRKPPLFTFASFSKKQVLLFVIGLISFAFFLAPYQIADFINDSIQMNTFLSLVSTISGIFLIVISINAGQKHHYQAIANLAEKARKDQEKYFQLLLNKEEETKKLRHDFNNHLYSIKYLLEKGNTGELKKYLDDMDIVSAKLAPEIHTGSDIINAIICELKESYKDVNYLMDWKGYFPSETKLAPFDLSSIFYNLLSNAIEAVEKLPGEADRTISVKVKHSHNLLYIGVKNPCMGKAIKAGSSFTTSKASSALHGFGSKNVALSVQKYGGELKYSIAENEFEAEIFFADLQ
jgi:signal transduction histidine kinase